MPYRELDFDRLTPQMSGFSSPPKARDSEPNLRDSCAASADNGADEDPPEAGRPPNQCLLYEFFMCIFESTIICEKGRM
jgi:hypothetical protein